MYCDKCGIDNADDAAFCRGCGREFPEIATRVAVRKMQDEIEPAAPSADHPDNSSDQAVIFSISPTLMFVKAGYVAAAIGALVLTAAFAAFLQVVWAGVFFGLCLFLIGKIRDGSTNDYRQYWSFDESNNTLLRPKPENDCRDALLSDLTERLGGLGVDAVKEGYYAEDRRADIRVSFGGVQGFNVPIEIKKDSHADLWRAIHEQLIQRYTRDPGADGFGIYLVFWFGGEHMPLPQEGKKPRSAAELEERLRQTLSV